MLALSATGLSINDRFAVNHGLSEVAAARSRTQGGNDADRDALLAAATDVLHRPVVLLLDLVTPGRVVDELRARYSGRTKAPEAARRFLLDVATAVERGALGKAA